MRTTKTTLHRKQAANLIVNRTDVTFEPKIRIGSTAIYSSEIYSAALKRAVPDTLPPSRKLPDSGWKEGRNERETETHFKFYKM